MPKLDKSDMIIVQCSRCKDMMPLRKTQRGQEQFAVTLRHGNDVHQCRNCGKMTVY